MEELVSNILQVCGRASLMGEKVFRWSQSALIVAVVGSQYV